MAINLRDRIRQRQEAFEVEQSQLVNAPALLQDATSRPITELDPMDIAPFSDANGRKQPYSIQMSKVLAIAASVSDIGFLQPIIVREMDSGCFTYQVLSGHHRLLVAQKLVSEGEELMIPAIIYHKGEIDDEKAYQIVAESNTESKEQLPSERSEMYARYMRLNKLRNKSEQDKVSELLVKFQIAKKTFYRYLGMQKLIPELRTAIDNKIINIAHYDKIPAAFGEDEQLAISCYIDEQRVKKFSQGDIEKIYAWKEQNEDIDLTTTIIYELLHKEADDSASEEENEEVAEQRMSIYDKIRAAFPDTELASMSKDDLDELILRRLASYVAEIVVDAS